MGHWFLPNVYLIHFLILFEAFPNYLLVFHFFIQVFPQDLDLLMAKDEGKFCTIPAASDSTTAVDSRAARVGSSHMSCLRAKQTALGPHCEDRLQGKGYLCVQVYVSEE